MASLGGRKSVRKFYRENKRNIIINVSHLERSRNKNTPPIENSFSKSVMRSDIRKPVGFLIGSSNPQLSQLKSNF